MSASESRSPTKAWRATLSRTITTAQSSAVKGSRSFSRNLSLTRRAVSPKWSSGCPYLCGRAAPFAPSVASWASSRIVHAAPVEELCEGIAELPLRDLADDLFRRMIGVLEATPGDERGDVLDQLREERVCAHPHGRARDADPRAHARWISCSAVTPRTGWT